MSSSNGRRPKLSVVSVNYNSAKFLKSCLESILRENVDRVQIVDNASRESDRNELLRMSAIDPRVQVTYSNTNIGFGGGVNCGVSLLSPEDDDVVVILNPDTEVRRGSLDLLYEALRKSDLDIVSPVIFTGRASFRRTWYAGGTLDMRAGRTVHFGFGKEVQNPIDPREVSFITGASPALTGKAWRQLGGFRDDLFLYWEDADLSLRAAKLGMKLGIVREAEVWHAEGGSSEQRGRSLGYYYYMQRNRILVLRPEIGLRKLLFGRGLAETVRLMARAIREPDKRFRRILFSASGLIDGVRGKAGKLENPMLLYRS